MNFNIILLFVLVLSGCQSNPYKQGHQLYIVHCEGCHMEDGSGLAKLIPSLEKSDFFDSSPDRLICLIRTGIPKNESTGQEMPPNTQLNEVEMANLVNYLQQVYTSGANAVKTDEVTEYLKHCKAN